MTANPFSRRGLSTVPLLAPLLVATACASSRPAIAPQAPMATTADAKSNVPNPVPTSGTIAVSADIRAACGISDEDAYFTFDSAALENKDISPLDAIARCFTVGPLKGRGMRLVGHADPRGSSEYNLVLGQRRADSVEDTWTATASRTRISRRRRAVRWTPPATTRPPGLATAGST